jgi:hypothetical protein
LITGDRVTVATSASGATTYAVHPAPGTAGFESFQAGDGDRYIVPAAAVPYLGQLDRSLFDVTALAAAAPADSGPDGPARIPVALSYPAGSAPVAPAGVTVTSAGDRTATGYLTPASAPSFAAALRRLIGADVAAGRPAGTTPLPARLSAPSAPTAAATTGVHPNYPLHILQLGATDLSGQAVNGEITLTNTDSTAKETDRVDLSGGIARIAVPAGHYAAYATFFDYGDDGQATAARQVALDGFTVPEDATGTTYATVDERTATSKVTVVSPKPAVQDLVDTTVARFDATGKGLITVGVTAFSGLPLYATPVPEPAVGSLHYVVHWGGAAPDPDDHYRVDLAFPAAQIPADESFTGRADQLATVRDAMYSDPQAARLALPATLLNGPVDPVLLAHSYGSVGYFVPGGQVTTEYLGTADTGGWFQAALTPTAVLMLADPRTYRGGQHATVDWGRGPVVPGLGQWTTRQLCDACSSGDTVSLALPLFRDSVPDHSGSSFGSVKAHFALYRDDALVFEQAGYGAVVTGVPHTPAVFRGVLDVDQTGGYGISQGLVTHTEETVRYDPDATGTPLSGDDSCYQDAELTPCQVSGAITVDYRLAADLTNTSGARLQTMGLRVGHVAYHGVGSRSPITSVTVSVSFDGGRTWQRAAVAGALGRYAAVWPNPVAAAGTSPSLKVTARDAAGDAFSQTVSAAYTIAASGDRADSTQGEAR